MSIVVTNNQPTATTTEAKAADVETKVETKPDAEVKASAETDQDSGTDETESGEGEDLTEETESSDETEEKPKRKSGIERRFRKMTARISAAEQRADAAARRAEALELELSKSRASDGTNSETRDTTSDDGRPTRPNKDDFQTLNDYENAHDAYIEKVADWKADQRHRVSEMKAERQRQVQSFQTREAEYTAKTPGYSKAIKDAVADGLRLSTYAQYLLERLDDGPKILHEMCNNREEFERINALPADEVGIALGELRASLKSPQEKVEKKTTRAPTPIKPVGGGGSSKPIVTLEDAAKAGSSEYQRVRMEQMKKQRSSWG